MLAQWIKKPQAGTAICFITGVFTALLVATANGPPIPHRVDEFAYLLGADTFNQGRLSNPAPPDAEYFYAPHILSTPTYQMKYPPGQSFILALGMIAGHPYFGVALLCGLFGAALCWGLQGHFNPAYALLGGMTGLLLYGPATYFVQSYWGGLLFATGGSLILGAVFRYLNGERLYLNGVLLGLGITCLLLSRPFEGFLFCLIPASFVLAYWIRKDQEFLTSLRKIITPALVILILYTAFSLNYNKAVTGDALTLPYVAYEEKYAAAPLFAWQDFRETPEVQNHFHSLWMMHTRETVERIRDFSTLELYFLRADFWRSFYTPHLWIIPFITGIVWLFYRRKWSLLMLSGGIILLLSSAFLISVFYQHHYHSVIALPVVVLILYGLKAFGRLAVKRPKVTKVLPIAMLMICIVPSVIKLGEYLLLGIPHLTWTLQRREVTVQLQHMSKPAVVVVDYTDEAQPENLWHANGANLSDTEILWAQAYNQTAEEVLEFARERNAASLVWVKVGAQEERPLVRFYEKGSEYLKPTRPPLSP